MGAKQSDSEKNLRYILKKKIKGTYILSFLFEKEAQMKLIYGALYMPEDRTIRNKRTKLFFLICSNCCLHSIGFRCIDPLY